jgi:hypothetical protein
MLRFVEVSSAQPPVRLEKIGVKLERLLELFFCLIVPAVKDKDES